MTPLPRYFHMQPALPVLAVGFSDTSKTKRDSGI